jgi:hypothetical protein
MTKDWLINSLTQAEYLVTFNAFIYGYIMSRFFSGWGRLISNRKNLIFSIEHVFWSIFAFLMLVSLWWYSWVGIKTLDTRSYTFYTSLLSPFIMYLISSLYFPETVKNEVTDLGKDSRFQRRQSAILYIILYCFLLVREYLGPLEGQNAFYFIIGIVVCTIVLFSRKRWIGQLTLLVGFITIIVYMFNVPSFTSQEYWSFSGFTFAEYITTFLTFIYGFIVAKFLDGWSYFVLNRRTIRLHAEYLLWTALIFGLIIDFWWGLWNRSMGTSRHFSHLLLTMLIPIGFSMIASLLFNDTRYDSEGFQESFSKNSILIFSFLIAIFGSDFFGARFISGRPVWHIENLFLLTAIAVCVIAITLRNKKGHRIALLAGWATLIAHNVTGS